MTVDASHDDRSAGDGANVTWRSTEMDAAVKGGLG